MGVTALLLLKPPPLSLQKSSSSKQLSLSMKLGVGSRLFLFQTCSASEELQSVVV